MFISFSTRPGVFDLTLASGIGVLYYRIGISEVKELSMTLCNRKINILQTGRLGDLWFTTPLAWHLHCQGYEVAVVYNSKFGNPFSFFPYVKPMPVKLRDWFPGPRFGYGFNEMIWQPAEWVKLKFQGQRVIWNQIFPYRSVLSLAKRKPFVECWYERYPQINFRRAPCDLKVTSGDTILVFTESQSIRFTRDQAHRDWVDRNLRKVMAATGFRPVIVAWGSQPDHPEYETWRGSLEDYQRLIAGCGLVYGISTSSHVLGQLLGKPVIVLYDKNQHPLGRIGGETMYICQGDDLPCAEDVAQRIQQSLLLEQAQRVATC